MAICCGVLLTKAWHLGFTAKGHTSAAKQSSHSIPTPRIGGLGLLAFFAVSLSVLDGDAARLALLLALSAIPVFLGGFGEDTGFDVTPKMRLLLSFVSACIAGIILNAWIVRTGVPLIDGALSFTFASIVFSIVISGGICHAINLVDGLNGLSLGLTLLMCAALALIAVNVGDIAMTSVILVFAGAVAGVLVFNFPLGKIFLGDAGAYTIGHMMTWMSILLMTRNPEIAPFAIFLIFFWPVADMLFSIIRRIRNGKPIDEPDRMHFHQFVMRALELTVIKRRTIANPLAAAVIWPMAAIPVALAVTFYNANLFAAVAWLLCFALFVWTYVAGVRTARFLSRARRSNENLLTTISRVGFTNIRSAAAGKAKVYPAE